jgi:cytochrome c peroxidase
MTGKCEKKRNVRGLTLSCHLILSVAAHASDMDLEERPLKLLSYIMPACAVLVGAAGIAGSAPGIATEKIPRSEWKKKYVRPAAIPFPEDNPFSKEKELLGRTLFFDPRLSGSGSIACSSCHNPGFSWGDGLPKAIGFGTKILGRRSPTILNSAWTELLFWDGRADSLEQQALGPIKAPGEMNQDLDTMVATIKGISEYGPLFAKAYPNEPIGTATVAKAIATFERTIVSGQAPFDEWIAGREDAISEDAKSGFDLFNGKAECAKCHIEWLFSDSGFHDIGVEGSDLGRGQNLHLAAMQGAFKTPTFRNVDRRAPYMHDGSEATLEEVIEFYDQGGKARRPSLAPEIAPLKLSSVDKQQLLEFLKTLTSHDVPVVIPVLPR